MILQFLSATNPAKRAALTANSLKRAFSKPELIKKKLKTYNLELRTYTYPAHPADEVDPLIL